MKKTILYFILFLSALKFEAQVLPMPSFSKAPGFYPDSIILTMSTSFPGASIYYTLNGSEPTQNSILYTSPITFKDRTSSPNNFSAIPTNPSFNYPKPGYDTSRADSRGWLPPYTNCFKAITIKAKVFKAGYVSDSTRVASYFFNPLLSSRYSLPVLSIIVDSLDFFADTTGIYVYGIDSINNGNYSKLKEDRKIHIELFEADGTMSFSQYCNTRINGNGGRHAPQKSLKIIPQIEYGNGNFDYSFFPDRAEKNYDRILLRNAGHRPDCMPRDDIAGEILHFLDLETQHNRHSIVFVNGEYWGIQTFKEIFDENYIADKYKLDPHNVIILQGTGTLDQGMPGDEQSYTDLKTYFNTTDMTLAASYDHAKEIIDIKSFTDFECAEIYIGNGDWPNNNTRFWKQKQTAPNPNLNNHMDGKWRWMIYDLDAGFGGDCSSTTSSHNSLKRALDTIYNNYTLMLRSLTKNAVYKNYFINRYADLLNTGFTPQRVKSKMNYIFNILDPELMEHTERWRYPSTATDLLTRSTEIPSLTSWNTIKTGLLDYSDLRPSKTRKQFMAQFSFIDTSSITLNVNDTAMGLVRINSLYLEENLIRDNSSVYPWTGIYFEGNPIELEAIAYTGYKFKNWNSSNTLSLINPNLTSDTTATAVFELDTAFKAQNYVFINEVALTNSSFYADEYKQFDDWIEIYNPNSFDVDMAGWYFTDDVNNKKKHRFPFGNENTKIKALSFAVIFCDNNPWQGCTHTNFKLNSLGDTCYLILPDGVTTLDSVFVPATATNQSWGRESDGIAHWINFATPTPNSDNRIITAPEPTDFYIYPNPSNGTSLNLSRTTDVEVYDVLGHLVMKQDNTKLINISNLASGIYFIKNLEGSPVKFIKQ